MLKRTLIPAAGAFALAAIALSPQSATAANWPAAQPLPKPRKLICRTSWTFIARRHWRRHAWWGAPFVAAPLAYGAYGGPGWHYQYYGPHKRRCGYTRWGYTCW